MDIYPYRMASRSTSSPSKSNTKKSVTWTNSAGRAMAKHEALEVKDSIEIGDWSVDQESVFLVGDAEIDGGKSLVSHHISSTDDLYSEGIPQIITQVFQSDVRIPNPREHLPDGKNIATIHVKTQFSDVVIEKAKSTDRRSGNEELEFPINAIRNERTYSSRMYLSAKITATAIMKDGSSPIVRTDTVEKLSICEIPTMVGSSLCNTRGMSREALQAIGEDPDDPGGYFIIKGIEWVTDCIENNLFNQIRIHENKGHEREVMRGEFISKPGDASQNQAFVIVRWLNDGGITIEIVRDSMKMVQIPFYLMFRLMGWSQDKMIFDHIIQDYGSGTAKDMMIFLRNAFSVKYQIMEEGKNVHDIAGVVKVIADFMKNDKWEYMKIDETEDYKQAAKTLFTAVDIRLLTHVGTEPPDRDRKLRFLCLIIRKIFLVKLKVLEPTDRDSFKNKRIHAAGVSYAKPFKTTFNQTFIQKIKNQVKMAFKIGAFSQVNLSDIISSSVSGADFERLLVQSITSGNKSQLSVSANRKITNRLSSQLLVRKNWLNVIATLRQVTTTTSDNVKQSERASEMRRVHSTSQGYICCVHSPEGGNVGINKQLSIFASITPSSSSEVLKNVVRQDKDMIPDTECPPERIARENLKNVYVNGDWIACTKDPLTQAKKYRDRRRAGLGISPTITVHWENTANELYLWADVGRLLRPLIIVYNNRRDKEIFPPKDRRDDAPFKQGTALTKRHIKQLFSKKITIDDLVRDRVVEYISVEEQENCLVCPSFDQLRDRQGDELEEYTHCDIPEAIMGITALTCPYGDHNQVGRVIYQTNQAKSTCGEAAGNWPFRFDKDAYMQFIVETPIVTTVASRYTNPNGCNVMLALMCYSGFSQEDALIISKGAVDRGLFNGVKFTYMKTTEEQNEVFGNPDEATTTDIKSGNFEKLSDGIIREGAVLEKNDAVIGKQERISKGDDKFMFSDRSIIYRSDEPAIVQNVVRGKDQNGDEFCKVGLRKSRPVAEADKFSSRAAQKGVCALLMKDSDMPRDKNNVAPEILMNPHAIPSRMTIAQPIESQIGNLCVAEGVHTNGTIFHPVDINEVGDKLEKMGLNRGGYHKLYSGITGEPIDVMIFMGPVYFQRLQKFVVDQIYSVTHGPTDATTYQPLDGGKSNHGGLRISELVTWCLTAHGISRFMSEKFRDHSDGYMWAVCRNCSSPAIVNVRENIYKCRECKDNADIVEIPTTWSSKLTIQEITAANARVRINPKPFTYEQEMRDEFAAEPEFKEEE